MLRTLAACASLLLTPIALAEGAMRSFELNGLILSGAEYWPYHGTTELNYPDDVLWGFYPVAGVPEVPGDDPNPDSATPAAVACAEQAYAKLVAFFAADDADFKRVVELGRDHLITNKFYLWTNDYTRAADPYPFGVRSARMWYWKRNPQVPGRTYGFWKWESSVLQDGTCLVPDDAQIRAYVAAKLVELGASGE